MTFSFFHIKLYPLLIILVLSLFTACEDEIPTGVIESSRNSLVIKKIIVSDWFAYSPNDSLFKFQVEINNSDFIKEFWVQLRLADGSETLIEYMALKDDGDLTGSGDISAGDNIFSVLLPMSKQFPSGKYVIEGFVLEKNEASLDAKKVFAFYLDYNSESENYSPEITEVIVPSSGSVNQRITLSVKVSDPNGLNDIIEVYYELYRPDETQVKNSQGISKFPMFDDGNSSKNGDANAGDGVYTVFIRFPEGQPLGKWRFVFSARDRSGAISKPVEFYFILN
ncbi:hypothetical protein [Melioribacter sp. OK-6-Me]|uniref:hypothetical protein n=1 Tax=unclassified Melioribacter TaxID=2627329 RepID=UPI003EDA4166